MKYCDKCNVTIQGTSERCPLCNHKLTGEPTEAVYPMIPSFLKRFEKIIRLLALISIALVILSAAVNMMLPSTGRWALMVFVGVICFWITLVTSVMKKDSIPQNVAVQAIVITLLSVFWDYLTHWHNWSIDYVMPIVFSAAVVSIMVVVRILKIPPADYIFSLTACIFFAVVPGIMYARGHITVRLPSLICITVSLLSLTTLLTFEWKDFWDTIKRKFHI